QVRGGPGRREARTLAIELRSVRSASARPSSRTPPRQRATTRAMPTRYGSSQASSMAEPARAIGLRTLPAGEGPLVRVASDPSALVPADAEGSPCTAVAACAELRLAPCGASVIVALTRKPEPSGRVRALPSARRCHLLLLVAVLASARSVAGGAETRVTL